MHEFGSGEMEAMLPVRVAYVCASDGQGPFMTLEEAARHCANCPLTCAQCRDSARLWLAAREPAARETGV